ncbi:hypothetical protein XA67_12360 [Comamonas thiooxydans]|nr:hypothetical protein XA67_12360 [Comamonas thiooxydans]
MAVLPALDLAQPGCKPCPKAPQASDASGAFYMHTWRVKRIAAHSQSLIFAIKTIAYSACPQMFSSQ